ncbi:hypothetical protein COS93_00125 [bacterium (Candidatus Gribaldobacteria) CG07_land_8_20_14_0_80_33_18]|uniref:Bacterial type II secretion system protein E domain-containing protein n=1 Tax=bacterium (Candidatus Gribaldobacteria) CG07_land_8_20_14_0_80_33_18 TaxID=2014272 RepID=A0A2M6Z4C4_9BACT|nr:MAG: hypothetical protein COU04_02060 [bacterium (Candidatus Gribaldobacteria) CG10_big_fil_rev_8_21_14_0_10_33_41]PIU47264.1 MAG: hypothetical protein COS93_00125 [bacterium (Candidatus Gribaldobacteria) CG07_land_8_20_14_0_80_33_18]PJA00973.1 MAG: hypothetical protein COX75_01125 [bacterium (Candidatus Gribaldobacteria) CG_4_10_14_0_2_um_filter_33_15]
MDLIFELTKKGILDKKRGADLRLELKKTGETTEEMILKEKIVSEDFLFKLKSEVLEIPFKETLPEEISPEILKIIPKDAVSYYKLIPFSKDRKGVVEIGMVYPENIQAQEALKFLARQQKLSFKVFLIKLSDFKRYLEKYKTPSEEMTKVMERLEEEIKIEEKPRGVEGPVFERLVEEAPIIKMVSVILRQAIEGKASDIHIEPTRENLKIRYRLDGILHSSLVLPLKVHPAIIARIKILSGLKIDETRLPQDGRFSAKINEKYIDFRVSTYPTSLGEKAAIRVLDPLEGLKPLDQLGLNERDFELAKRAIEKPTGMILATGPTGSGKTTTLYSILQILNTEEVNIVTLEDPIEYFLNGLNQSQVKPEIDYTFARGLRQILRQDPDIIMVGEIRDEETANLVIHATLTGHLVLSTLHTSDSLGIIPRLIDMGIAPFLIPSTLTLGFSQRLIRVLCPFCKKEITASEKIKEIILKKINNLPENLKKKIKIPEPLIIFEPVGCKKCNFKGYSGRLGIFEVLTMTDGLSEIITSGRISEAEILKEARAQGMITMEEDGILKVLQGITSFEEITRVAEEA